MRQSTEANFVKAFAPRRTPLPFRPLQVRSPHSMGPVALPRVVTTRLCRRGLAVWCRLARLGTARRPQSSEGSVEMIPWRFRAVYGQSANRQIRRQDCLARRGIDVDREAKQRSGSPRKVMAGPREHNRISFVARTSPSHPRRYRIRFQR